VDEKPASDKPASDRQEKRNRRRITRRTFVGTMGAAAAASSLQFGRAQPSAAASQVYYYQDSFGNVIPVDPALTNVGIYPAPLPASTTPPTNAATPAAYQAPNILLIMVDQMRNPAFWLPSGNNWLSTYSTIMPNITQLARQYSFVFPNYFVAATVCTPSRACLLTGLYSQQTCIFETTSGSVYTPSLLPFNPSWTVGNNNVGFPTIGNVLSNVGYDCAWIGKWHLSCYLGNSTDTSPGAHGPSDYGFSSRFNIPTTNISNPYPAGTSLLTKRGYASPNGLLNEGAGGDFLDSYTQNSVQAPAPTYDVPAFGYNTSGYPVYYNNSGGSLQPVLPEYLYRQLSDAAIASAFTDYYLTSGPTTPWFCAVSFINPHDIGDFPWGSGFVSPGNNTQFMPPGSNNTVSKTGYQPAPMASSNTSYPGYPQGDAPSSIDEVLIPGFNSSLYSALPPGTGNSAGPWNFETPIIGSNKPHLQWYFQQSMNNATGIIEAPTYNSGVWSNTQAWQMFLNYYAWLESCVDYQVGQVLGTNPSATSGLYQSGYNSSTIVIFTSDHGDYVGSHGLHGKGGALYDESLNVPLIVNYPQFRAVNNSSGNGFPLVLPYTCSSVDLLPYLYSLALGSDSNMGWRSNNNDMIFYLNNRESIFDAIMYYNNGISYYPSPGVPHRRISGIPLYNNNNANHPYGNSTYWVYQPFVLHTTDEYPSANMDIIFGGSNNFQPSHAIAFRTVDQTEVNNNAAPFFNQMSYGGGKLGVYTHWNTLNASSAPIEGILGNASIPVDYEFYNYSPSKGNANPQEVGNQFLNGASVSALAEPYLTDFLNVGNNNGFPILDELYFLNTGNSSSDYTKQVTAAVQTAFDNYFNYLNATSQLTGYSFVPTGNGSNNVFYQW